MNAIETPALFDGEALLGRRAVLIEDGMIADVAARAPKGMATTVLPPGTVLAPGFIDLQINGGDGVLFNDEPTTDGLRRLAAAHLRDGTTALLPTLISGEPAVIRQAVAAARSAVEAGMDGILGIHIEGPYISRARRGIHPEAAITALSDSELAYLCEDFPGARLITLAPEIVPPAHIAALAAAGYTVFLGHSDAACDTVLAALDAGAAGFTHLFNAMSQFGSRAPGMVGAAMAHDAAFVSIIADGLHAHPVAVRAAWRAIGPARLCLISDAMPSVGSNQGFALAGKPISLNGGKLTDVAGTLAGAHLTMREAVRNAVQMIGIPLADALRMATAAPADSLRLRDRGRIRPGSRADLVALDPAFGLAGVCLGGVCLGGVWLGGAAR